MEIQVKIHHRWKTERSIVERVARIVCYDDTRVATQDTGYTRLDDNWWAELQDIGSKNATIYTWRLDDSNDWWAELQDVGSKNATIKVAWRYGGGNEPVMQALKVFLEYALG